jgi:predicted ATPase
MSRALTLVAALPATTALRREQLRLQVALITPLFHVRGYASPEARAAAEQARLLIEQAQALGEAPDDPLLPFAALYGIWLTFVSAFDGDKVGGLAEQFLSLAEKQDAVAPRLIAHQMMGISSLYCGEIAAGRAHLDRAIALYDPTAHRALATRFAVDPGVAILCRRSYALWSLGYPEAAPADVYRAIEAARDIGLAATLMYALVNCWWPWGCTGDDVATERLLREAIALAAETGGSQWKGPGAALLGCVLTLRGSAAEAIDAITSGLADWRATGSTAWQPLIFSYLAGAHSELGQFDEAWRWIGEAMLQVESSKEKWAEAEIHRLRARPRFARPCRTPRGGIVFQRCARDCPAAAGEILGAAERDELRAADARPGAAARCLRPARAGLLLVHGRLREEGPQGRQGAARRAGRQAGSCRKRRYRDLQRRRGRRKGTWRRDVTGSINRPRLGVGVRRAQRCRVERAGRGRQIVGNPSPCNETEP